MSAGDLSVGQIGGVRRPAPSAGRRGRETRAERGFGSLAPSAGLGASRRAPRGRRVTPTAMPTPPRAIPWADLLAAPFTAKSKMRNIKTGVSGLYRRPATTDSTDECPQINRRPTGRRNKTGHPPSTRDRSCPRPETLNPQLPGTLFHRGSRRSWRRPS
jgi:hypothetical protein